MKKIFVNLKRFEVAKSLGGICPDDNPIAWTRGVIKASMECGLGRIPGVKVAYMLPGSFNSRKDLFYGLIAMLREIFDCGHHGAFPCGAQKSYRRITQTGQGLRHDGVAHTAFVLA
jgi:hypothetical protein